MGCYCDYLLSKQDGISSQFYPTKVLEHKTYPVYRIRLVNDRDLDHDPVFDFQREIDRLTAIIGTYEDQGI